MKITTDMKKLLAPVIVLAFVAVVAATSARAQSSSINTGVPASNANLTSLAMRQQFLAAANDINGLLGKHSVTSLGQCPASPVVMQDCVTVGSSPYVWYIWTGSAGGWAQFATINPSTGIVSVALNAGNIAKSSPITVGVSGNIATIGIALDGNFTVNGSSQLALNPGSANLFLATPNGSSGEPSLRALVGADLPAPSASTLGGVNSIAQVSHQWVQYIDTAGLPHLLQPGFSDLSGSLSPSQCPAGTASTIGCLEGDGATLSISAGVIGINLAHANTWAAQQTFTAPVLGAATGTSLALGGATLGGNALAVSGTTDLITNSASGFVVGQTAGGNMAFQIDASAGSLAAGLKVTGAATGGTVAIATIDTGSNNSLSINAKGSGSVSIGGTSTGGVSLAAGGGGVTIAGPVAGSFTMSGVITHSGQNLFTATTAPSSAAGNTNVLGTLASVPTLANTGQGNVFNTAAGGLVLQGDGSSNDFSLYNKGGSLVLNVPTGTTVPQLPGLSAGTCSKGLALDSGNNIVTGSCPGAASSIQVGTTSVSSATSNTLLGPGSVSGGNGTLASVSAGAGISISASQIALALNSAFLSAQPSNPAGTSSSTPVMMGLGVTTCRFTPVVSTRAEFEIIGDFTNSAAGTVTIKMSYADSAVTTAPANGAASTGTAGPGSVLAPTATSVSDTKPFKNGGIVTGLTVGHTYWFDLIVGTSTGTANILAPTCNAKEVL